MTILLDAAGTLIHPANPVGEVYARHLRISAGLPVDPGRMHAAFLTTFAAAPPPDYSLHPFGHAAEHAWWREFVAAVLQSLGGEPAEFVASRISTLDSPPTPLKQLATAMRPAPSMDRELKCNPGTFDQFFDSLYSHFSLPAAWSLFPETVDFLQSASTLGPLAVVSNFDDRLAPILDGLGIGPFFELILTSADARARKPNRAIFDLALDRLNSAPGQTAHCGDSREADFDGATAAGLRAFHLQRPAHSLLDFLQFCRS